MNQQRRYSSSPIIWNCKHENFMSWTIDLSILDQRWGKTQKVKTETRGLEMEAAGAQDLKSLSGPWVKMRNWVSMEEDIEFQVKVEDTVETTDSCTALVMAKDTEKLVRVEGQDHSFVVKEDQDKGEQDHSSVEVGHWAQVGQDHSVWARGVQAHVDQEEEQKMVADSELDLEIGVEQVIEIVAELGFHLDRDP